MGRFIFSIVCGLFLAAFFAFTNAALIGERGVVSHQSVERTLFSEHAIMERQAPVGSRAPNITDRNWLNTVLARVDLWRENHGAEPLVWSLTLATYAMNAANRCLLQHTVSLKARSGMVSSHFANEWLGWSVWREYILDILGRN